MSKKTTKEVTHEPYFLTEEESHKFCEETEQLARGVKFGLTLLSERLYKIKKQKLYRPQYQHFYMFCRQMEMHESVASRLVGIYEKLVLNLQVPFEEIKTVEYTKLYEIKKASESKEMALAWLELVNNPVEEHRLSRTELVQRIEKDTGKLINEEEECTHGNTYLVRKCRDCGAVWEEFGETVHTHEESQS